MSEIWLSNNMSKKLVISRLDYCNSLYFGLPKIQILKLQCVQNRAAKIIFRLPKSDHISLVLAELHWLPIETRIQFKMLLLVYKCLHGLAPSYLRSLLTDHKSVRALRSNSMSLLYVPRTKSCLGARAFSASAPVLWNELSANLKDADSVSSFKISLKTYLFRIAFTV